MTFFAFLFGLIFGSFANVILLRLNTGESLVRRGSRCFSCGKPIRWFDLIPLLSFFALKGKCRDCKSRISWQYPLVEFGSGLLFLLVFLYIHPPFFISFGLFLYILCVTVAWFFLWIAALYDIRHMILPDVLLAVAFAFGVGGFALGCQFANAGCSLESIAYQLGVAVLGFLFFFFLWLVSRGRWMGLGDAKFVIAIAPLLSPYMLLLALMLSFLFGTVISVVLLAFQRAGFKTQVPFGPFLFAGAFVSFLAGSNILAWYIGLFS